MFPCGISDNQKHLKFTTARQIAVDDIIARRPSHRRQTHFHDAPKKYIKNALFWCNFKILPTRLRISLPNLTRYTASIKFTG
jgi:hypothetical protein